VNEVLNFFVVDSNLYINQYCPSQPHFASTGFVVNGATQQEEQDINYKLLVTISGVSGYEILVNYVSFYYNYQNVDEGLEDEGYFSSYYQNFEVQAFFYHGVEITPCDITFVPAPNAKINQRDIVDFTNRHPNLNHTARYYPEYDDMTWEQFRMTKLGALPPREEDLTPMAQVREYAARRAQMKVTLPAAYDPRTATPTYRGWPAVNQGSCGSCWTFSASDALSPRIFTALGQNTKLSQQMIGSCGNGSPKDLCQGGWPPLVFTTMQNQDIVPDWCQPYTEKADAACPAGCGQSFTYRTTSPVAGYARTGSGLTETDIMTELFTNGPMAACIFAGNDFSAYSTGVLTQTQAIAGTSINHAVTLVGWGTDPNSNVPYWLVKNSWGPGWGENGYFRIRRGNNDLNFEVGGFAFATPIFGTSGGPTSCGTGCQNGGELKRDCTCLCNSPWTGTDCSTCSKSCGTGGTLDSTACTCTCQAGYFGSDCQIQIIGTASSGSVTWELQDPNFHAGDKLLVNPPLAQGQAIPSTVSALQDICGAETFPFQSCPSGPISISTDLSPGDYTAWIYRYQGNNEFGNSKGYFIPREQVSPVVTVT